MEHIYRQPDTLRTGLQTTPELDAPRPALRVSWIGWESGFRDSGLRVGDRIVAVAGAPVTRPRDPSEEGRTRPQLIGQYAEQQSWQGREDGEEVTLTALRRRRPGRGWEEIAARGRLLLDRSYRDEQNQPIFGVGGPVERERDGFDESWSSWYEDRRRAWERVLDDGWIVSPGSSEVALAEHLSHEPRVRLLQDRYPGSFASTVVADWELVWQVLTGRRYELSTADLAWRQRGEQRLEQVAAAGREARATFLSRHEAELLPPFPAIDPILGDRLKVAGRLVALPEVSNREWISQGPRTCFVISDGASYYVADAEGEAMQRALLASRRYEGQLGKAADGRYGIIGRILPDPGQVVISDRSYFALKVEPVAVSFGGDALFVEVGAERGAAPTYAGERADAAGAPPPPDDAEPEAVMAAFFAALKAGEQRQWAALFSSFQLRFTDAGQPLVEPDWLGHEASIWSSARAAILSRIYDVVVVWRDEQRDALSGADFPGAPRIEEVTLEVDHVGRGEDGAYHGITEAGLQRRWILQRMDSGPWRIATRAGL